MYSANPSLISPVLQILLFKKKKVTFFLLDFQVEARCSYVRLDLSNNAWKGSVYQEGTFEDFRALQL